MTQHESNAPLDDFDALRHLQAAFAAGRLSTSAAENVRAWLTQPV